MSIAERTDPYTQGFRTGRAGHNAEALLSDHAQSEYDRGYRDGMEARVLEGSTEVEASEDVDLLDGFAAFSAESDWFDGSEESVQARRTAVRQWSARISSALSADVSDGESHALAAALDEVAEQEELIDGMLGDLTLREHAESLPATVVDDLMVAGADGVIDIGEDDGSALYDAARSVQEESQNYDWDAFASVGAQSWILDQPELLLADTELRHQAALEYVLSKTASLAGRRRADVVATFMETAAPGDPFAGAMPAQPGAPAVTPCTGCGMTGGQHAPGCPIGDPMGANSASPVAPMTTAKMAAYGVRYRDWNGRNGLGEIRNKDFPTEEARTAWLDKMGDDIEVMAYSDEGEGNLASKTAAPEDEEIPSAEPHPLAPVKPADGPPSDDELQEAVEEEPEDAPDDMGGGGDSTFTDAIDNLEDVGDRLRELIGKRKRATQWDDTDPWTDPSVAQEVDRILGGLGPSPSPAEVVRALRPVSDRDSVDREMAYEIAAQRFGLDYDDLYYEQLGIPRRKADNNILEDSGGGFVPTVRALWQAVKASPGGVIPRWFPKSLLTPEEAESGKWSSGGSALQNFNNASRTAKNMHETFMDFFGGDVLRRFRSEMLSEYGDGIDFDYQGWTREATERMGQTQSPEEALEWLMALANFEPYGEWDEWQATREIEDEIGKETADPALQQEANALWVKYMKGDGVEYLAAVRQADSMFPGAGAQVYRNEAGEPLGWDYPGEQEYDPDDWYDSDAANAEDAGYQELMRAVEDFADRPGRDSDPQRTLYEVAHDHEVDIYDLAEELGMEVNDQDPTEASRKTANMTCRNCGQEVVGDGHGGVIGFKDGSDWCPATHYESKHVVAGKTAADDGKEYEQGYEHGFEFALDWQPGTPLPEQATTGSAKDAYRRGFDSGVESGMNHNTQEIQEAWASANSSKKSTRSDRSARQARARRRIEDKLGGAEIFVPKKAGRIVSAEDIEVDAAKQIQAQLAEWRQKLMVAVGSGDHDTERQAIAQMADLQTQLQAMEAVSVEASEREKERKQGRRWMKRAR